MSTVIAVSTWVGLVLVTGLLGWIWVMVAVALIPAAVVLVAALFALGRAGRAG